MTRTTKGTGRGGKAIRIAALAIATVVTMASCGHVMMMLHGGAERPAASEFGLGPRVTSTGMYRVTLQPPSPLAKRKLQKVNVQVVDAAGAPVEGARIAVDGGMPEHGHGLPTRPKQTGRIGEGRYEIDGVRFNMGGWWEFKLKIAASPGTDSVTFNLDL